MPRKPPTVAKIRKALAAPETGKKARKPLPTKSPATQTREAMERAMANWARCQGSIRK